jgi:hypothetical protein
MYRYVRFLYVHGPAKPPCRKPESHRAKKLHVDEFNYGVPDYQVRFLDSWGWRPVNTKIFVTMIFHFTVRGAA